VSHAGAAPPSRSWLGSLFAALAVTAKNLGRPKTTAPLPWKGDRPRAERFRTSFALVHDEHGDEACIGCKMCERICPSFIITVVPGGRAPSPKTGKARGWCKDFTLDLGACIHCELCVQVCPTDAIVMLAQPEVPTFSREELLLTMEKLYANEPRPHSWGTGAKLVAMQEPPKPPAPPAAPAEPAPEKAP
jgi:NADH-quinone oxidoreductase subunit I